MKNLVKISDDENTGVLSINLNDILSCIDKIELYKWKILWLTAVGKNEKVLALNLETEINDSDDGYEITSNDLLKFNDLFSQIYEIVLIGDKDKSNLKRDKDNTVIQSLCTYYIELIDCAYWEITTDDEKMIKNIFLKFKNAKLYKG
jgi:hypothetical protein